LRCQSSEYSSSSSDQRTVVLGAQSAAERRSRRQSVGRSTAAPAIPDGTQSAGRISIATSAPTVLVAREDLSITRASCAGGQKIAKPHVHHRHTDAFYVLEGRPELGDETITLSAGEFVAVPPNVAHAFRTAGEAPARWLTIHAPDGGFAEFI